ncbi:30S ribosomal protein S20 [Candidatus Annandia adelgestsuga]|uniref:Small ribosomal subunit protein bS20 n=1 Tax=Candidatus Annandia adelgestsuga TaxID=1302411 RepID=A0A3S9J7H5_9ENTR|nr:30S ribosomal protein S20 [Candidatus Annandia adelgestsuga]AZP36253.1 30S ribosomal protein S20 [Candidatus Annandia adelgestsuga]
MANIKSSKKRIITNIKRKIYNKKCKSKIKNIIRKIKNFISVNNKKESLKHFFYLQPIIDRYSTYGIIHKNKSSRCKSRLIKKIFKM